MDTLITEILKALQGPPDDKKYPDELRRLLEERERLKALIKCLRDLDHVETAREYEHDVVLLDRRIQALKHESLEVSDDDPVRPDRGHLPGTDSGTDR